MVKILLKNEKNPISIFPLQRPHSAMLCLRMFSRMDPDNSGFVEEPEFEAYTRDQQLGMSEARIKQLYHTIKVPIY